MPSFKVYLLSSKIDNDIFFDITFTFSLIKVFSYSLNPLAIFTPFAVLDSLLLSESIESLFDFNPTKLLIRFPLCRSFILPITPSLTASKTLNLLKSYLNQTNVCV